MAAKFDKEMLKKHHFWFLFIAIGIALILAWVGLFVEVPDAISGTNDKNDSEKKKLTGVKAQPRKFIEEYHKQTDVLKTSRIQMWGQAWKEQKDVFVWPAGYTEKQLAVVRDLKFGDPIPEKQPESVRSQFRERNVYEAEYSKLIKKLEPMQFKDGWQKVLRHVETFGKVPDAEDMWLAMEDLWVQREVLLALHKINADAATFTRVTTKRDGSPAPDEKKHRIFQSGPEKLRIWELDLRVNEKDNQRILEGTLTNISPRLQVLGVGNKMTLKVWLTADAKQPYLFEVEGTSVEADQKPLIIKTIKSHILPPEWKVDEIARVEQQFDIRTVPVKRVDFLALGKLSDRNNNLTLKMAKFSEQMAKEEQKLLASEGGGELGSPIIGMPSPKGGMPGKGGGTPGPGTGPGVPGGYGQGGETGEATLPALSQNGLERYRYIDVTEQVRRMPLGVVVIADQSYMKDIMESNVNIKLRFQLTQVHWNRFHDTLSYTTSLVRSNPATGFPSPATGFPSIPGTGFPMMGEGERMYSSPNNSREDQFSANLMELSFYGIVSLYEKFEEGKEAIKDVKQPLKGAPEKTAPKTK